MVAKKQVVYDKWNVGEFGTQNPSQAPNGSWTGTNVVAYRDGMIGPRPGMREITFDNAPSKNGPMLGFGFSPTASTDDTPIFFILEDRVYLFDPDDGTTHLEAASVDLGMAPGSTDAQVILSKESVRLIGDEVYFSIDGDKMYRLNCRTQVLTPIADSAQGTDIELFRDRLFIPNGGVRVYYSNAADFTGGDPGNFFDVGVSYRVISILTFRDALFFFTQSGVWSMTGSSPAEGTFRRVSETLAPLDKGTVLTNDEIVYIPSSRSAPVTFNGSYGNERALAHLEEWKSPVQSAYGVQSYGNRDVLFLSRASELLWRKNDAWSFHDMGGDVGPWITRYFDDNVVLAYPGTASVDPRFYMLSMSLERPGFVTDTWAQPGDDSDTPLSASFTLPDYLAEQGKELRVRSVTVDFVKFDTGSSVANNISILAESVFQELQDGQSSQSPAPYTLFNEDGDFATPSGTFARRIYRGGAGPFAGGYRISFLNLRGVKISRVVVEFEEQNAPVT